MGATIWSATESLVTIEGETIEGVQSIDYKINRSRKDVIAVGQQLRQGVDYGVKVITGKIRVKSSCKKLDDLLAQMDVSKAIFSMQATLKKSGQQQATKSVDFQECYLDDREFTMDVNEVGIAVYTFSAKDVVESA